MFQNLTPVSVTITEQPDVTLVEMPLSPVRIKRRLLDCWKIPHKALISVTVHTENLPDPQIIAIVSIARWQQDSTGTIKGETDMCGPNLTVSLTHSELLDQERNQQLFTT